MQVTMHQSLHAAVVLLTGVLVVWAEKTIDITQPCRYPTPVGIEKEYIPKGNIWATSHTNIARGAEYARLNGYKGGGAWTAGIPNNEQRLCVDLGYRHVVTGISTQGRRGSYEFVTEYYLEFSSDNTTWNIYTNAFGTPKMFMGNVDDDGVATNDLEYPLIARYVCFNPQRWHQFISMRIELYGCRFDGEGISFDGHSRVTYDISGENQYVQTRQDLIKLRFRTNSANGLLLYADSNQGDYIVLEMLHGKLFLHMDLGSTATQSGDTSLTAGSLLDDNQWHDVEIVRDGRQINFTVDRLTIKNMTNGEFFQLDLDRYIHLGGIDSFLQAGQKISVRENFYGCMENVWFNYLNMVKDSRINLPRFEVHGAVQYGLCQLQTVVPFTFPTVDSYLRLSFVIGQRFRIGFHFRTYNKGGLLFTHKLEPSGRIKMKISDEGYIEYSVKTENEIRSQIRNLNKFTQLETFTDGLWHSVYVDIESGSSEGIGKINITVDGLSDTSKRQLNFATTDAYFIGGDDVGEETGFLGCMRFLEIGTERREEIPNAGNHGVIKGACTVQDRCDPNPCEHGGICSQDYTTFNCRCDHTGYEGAVCHRSKYLVSCEEARILNPTLPFKDMTIDIDDSGPLEPFPVTCVFQHETKTPIVEIQHDSMDEIMVDGYQEPGSYVRPIVYPVKEREQFDELIERAIECTQYIRYTCRGSKLLSSSGLHDYTRPSWGWWVSRTNQIMQYWGNSSPGSKKCDCALKNECRNENEHCNCDAGIIERDISDDGELRYKEHLPVMELRFGDTGTIVDEKKGWHELGRLKCTGDSFFNNTITFRKPDATIELPTFDARTSGDIRFQFRTTTENGIFLQNTGQSHFIEVKLVFGNTIHFRFNVGNGIQTLEQVTAYPLNDDQWHTLHIERNRREATLKVDQQAEITHDEPVDQGFRTLDLSTKLVIGAAVDYKDGYVGCMRALMINGKRVDLRGMVERGEVTYGVSSGCHPKCESNPCMNNGICLEWYSHYQCDCAYTPYRGWDCGREVGVNMQPNYMVRYEFDQESGNIATDEETIIIGFSTQIKKGILMQITNDYSVNKPEYISIEVNNNGGVKVAFDPGWNTGRQEVNNDVQGVDLANGQQHVVTVKRTMKGRKLELFVDDYPVKTGLFLDETAGSDTKLENPKYIYFGRNSTTKPGDGFKGCIYRAQFDNIYPLKRVFQDPRPDNILLEPAGKIREDMCGFEEVTHPPETSEFRPTPAPHSNMTGSKYVGFATMDDTDEALLGGILAVVLLILIGIAFLAGRYFSRHKGEYKTHEAKDAQYFDDPDYAVASSSTGQPEVSKSKEWFL